MYLGEGNRYMRQVSAALDLGFNEGTLHQRPALVNLQCDIDHPTQSMADMAKLRDYFGGSQQLNGKKIAMTWAYSPSYGKPLSVPQGIIGLMTRAGMEVTLAHPPGYNLIPDIPNLAQKQARESGGSFRIVDSMEEAFADADVVYPKSWAPYSVMQQRTTLLKAADKEGLHDLEQQCLANNARYKNWECTEKLMQKTQDGKALYMHCLPADISGVSCEQGEVSKSVFDRYKPFVIAAMIFLARLNTPQDMLNRILKNPKNRLQG
jgi:knotted carbamoyltransferase YgeW